MTDVELAKINAELITQLALLADVLGIPDGAALDAAQKNKIQVLQTYVTRLLNA